MTADRLEHGAALTVFAPSPILTVTIERRDVEPELHLHAGGQGVWVSRMAASLGGAVTLCTSLGGETGKVLRALLGSEAFELVSCASTDANGAYVHDRRDGLRQSLVDIPGPVLSRHELDDLYGITVARVLDSGALILTGPDDPRVIGADVYRRLAADARANDIAVIADLTGTPLAGALEGGVTLLKISDEELVSEGLSETGVPLLDAAHDLHERGAANVLISRVPAASVAMLDGRVVEIVGPRLTTADERGAGDSMTAAAAVGIASGLHMSDALRLAAAAGAVNAARHGLGTGGAREVMRLMSHVSVTPAALDSAAVGPAVGEATTHDG